MTSGRVAALERVAGWTWEAGFEAVWEENCAALRACIAAHGRLPPKAHPSGLGKWISHQRQAKRVVGEGRKGVCEMAPGRAAALEAVPG
jgi:hypothetical protein